MVGPTSFAPIIEMAMTIVEKSGGQYHVLLIIADGQVTKFSRYSKLNLKTCNDAGESLPASNLL